MTNPSRTLGLLTVAGAVLALLGLSGCTDDPKPPTRKTTPSTSASATIGGTARDRSTDMLAAKLHTAVATTSGTLDGFPVTLNISSVQASPTGTVLTFWYTGNEELLNRRGNAAWPVWPTLTDPAGKKVYEPTTFIDANGKAQCVCTDAAFIRGIPQPRTVLFPVLPEDVSSVQVTQPGFVKPATTPVSR